MFHLLKEDQQQLAYFVVVGIFLLIHMEFIQMQAKISQTKQLSFESEGKILKMHKKILNNRWISYCFVLTVISLHCGEKLITPPSSLPYLHNLLFAALSFMVNCYFLVIGNLIQIE
jgi:hypothetical protein